MIDWLTLRYEWGDRVFDLAPRLRAVFWERPLVVCMRQGTGEVLWSTNGRESIRSDTHQVVVEVTATSVTVQGSPARALGLRHNVFGPDSLHVCARAMLDHVRRDLAMFGIATPCYRAWKITRVDVTHNFVFARPNEVRQALAYLRQYDAGRYKVGSKSETVYWSQSSRIKSGKAYHKGPHLRYQMGKGQATVTEQEIRLGDHLLRLELALRAEWWRRIRAGGLRVQWTTDLQAEYAEYWGGLIGTCEITDMTEQEAIVEAGKRVLQQGVARNLIKLECATAYLESFYQTPTVLDRKAMEEVERVRKKIAGLRVRCVMPDDGGERYGRAAYATWCTVSAMGHKLTQEHLPPSTWYRHLAVFKEAGLSWGDIAEGKVIPLRREPLMLRQPARNWDDVQFQVDELLHRRAA